MNRVAITISALALTAALGGACSNSEEPATPPLDNGAGGGGGRSDGGRSPADDADVDGPDEDGGITDARDELVPTDASREQDSGDAEPEDGGDEDVPEEPECILDSDCADKVTVNVCEVARCRSNACVVEFAPLATPCDDGIECSSGGLCQDGVCHPGLVDVTRPECVDKPVPRALWITEVMGNPREIADSVDARGGQWIEITNRAAKSLHLQDVYLVGYAWPDGEPEPDEPNYRYLLLGDATLEPESSLVVAGSMAPDENGGLRVPFEFPDGFDLPAGSNIRLLLVMPDWGRNEHPSPIPPEHVIDSVHIPAGTFSEANRGRSWQASAPLPDANRPEERVFCFTAPDPANAYVEDGELKNYGTPGSANVGCAP